MRYSMKRDEWKNESEKQDTPRNTSDKTQKSKNASKDVTHNIVKFAYLKIIYFYMPN